MLLARVGVGLGRWRMSSDLTDAAADAPPLLRNPRSCPDTAPCGACCLLMSALGPVGWHKLRDLPDAAADALTSVAAKKPGNMGDHNFLILSQNPGRHALFHARHF